MKKELILGSHVSMAGKDMLLGSVEEALSYGSTTFMFYTGAPQNTRRKKIEDLKINEAKKLMLENNIDIEKLVVHAPYIINLANTTKEETFDIAKSFLIEELKRTAAIGAKYIVLHPGSHVNAGEEIGLKRIVEGLNYVFENDNSDVMILLETMAGKGSELGYTFEQLKWIMANVDNNKRLGVCLDTCHIHDAGYDIVNYLDDVLEKFDNVIGLDLLKVIHVNDSKNVMGAKKDRHANIGEGFIGSETIKKIVHHPKLEGKIFVLETPWIKEEGEKPRPPYKEEIKFLREE